MLTIQNIKIGMYPAFSNSKWEREGNPHLRYLQTSIENEGAIVIALNFKDIIQPCGLRDKGIDILHIHWPGAVVDYFLGYREPASTLTVRQNSGFRRFITAITSRVRTLFPFRYVKMAVAAVQVMLWIKELRRADIPVVWQIHDLQSHHLARDRAARKIDAFLHHELFKLARAVLVHEHSCVAPVKREFGEKALIGVVPLGSYVEVYGERVEQSVARERLNLPTKGRVLSYIGTARPNRNPGRVCDVFSRQSSENTFLYVAGVGVREYIKSGGSNIIVEDGYLSPNKLRDIVCASDFVINDGEKYLTSAVVRTAISYGVPVITRPYGASIDMASGASIYIEGSSSGLDEAIDQALSIDEAQLEVLRINALMRDEERVWDIGARVCMKIYYALLNKAG